MIKVYGAKGCYKCVQQTDYYDENDIEYEYIDINDLNLEERTELLNIHGASLPIVVDDSETEEE